MSPYKHMVERELRAYLERVRHDGSLAPEYCAELPEHPPVEHKAARTIDALTLSTEARKKISGVSSKPYIVVESSLVAGGSSSSDGDVSSGAASSTDLV